MIFPSQRYQSAPATLEIFTTLRMPDAHCKTMRNSTEEPQDFTDTFRKIGLELTRETRRDALRLSRMLHPIEARFRGPEAPLGIRCANAITGFMGSWIFLWIQTVLVGFWIAFNVFAWIKHFDPYPFILLNLAFSTQAAYAAPLILMAGNVAAARDRALWENDYETNQNAYQKIEELEKQVRALGEQNNQMLHHTQEVLALLVKRTEDDATPQSASTRTPETSP